MKASNEISSSKIWLFFLLLAVGPFLLRTGLDMATIQRQGVAELYRNMRFQSALKDWPAASPVIFERQNEKSALEDAFKLNLQRDFKISEIGDAPHIRVFFDSDTFLTVHVDIEMPASRGTWKTWEGSVRLVNNGILFGFWVGVLLFLLNRRLGWAVAVAISLTAFWQADWNLLEIPMTYFRIFSSFVGEVAYRWKTGNWNPNELSRLLELVGVLGFGLSLIPLMFKWLRTTVESLKVIFVFSMLMEPLLFFLATRAAGWGVEVSWWKIYLGSFAYRYLLFGHVFFAFMKTDYLAWKDARWAPSLTPIRLRVMILALPLVFIFSGGWAWSLAVFSLGSSSALLKLKIFSASFLLSFFLGSRIMSLVIASLVFAVIFPPTEGHWATSVAWAFLMDGVLLGWFLSPYKGYNRTLMIHSPRSRFFIVSAITWVLGIFMSSVGAPGTISWAALVVVLWGYSELIRSQKVEGELEAS